MKNLGAIAFTTVALVLVAVSCGSGSGLRPTSSAAAVEPGQVGTAVPIHTETWAYDDSSLPRRCNGGYGASSSLVRRWLTYAETNCGPRSRKALRDCHTSTARYCTVFIYLDANLIWSGSPIFTDHAPTRESWWLHQPHHTDPNHRLVVSSSDGIRYFLDQARRSVQRWVQRYLRAHFNPWDGVMMDDTAASTRAQFFDSGYSSSQEIRTNSGIVSEHRHMAGVLSHSNGTPFLQVDNGININPWVATTFPLLGDPASVVGLMAENEPWDYGLQPYYSTLLDYMAYVDTRPNDFIILLSYDSNGPPAARRVQEATVLLGYSPGHVVDWADLEQDNLDLAVWPEEGIYPTQPLETMGAPDYSSCLADRGVCSRGGHNDLQVAPGVYRREFGACYDQGVPFGHCAAIINTTSSPVTVSSTWLTQLYTREITMHGGDVQSGGSINTAGALFIPSVTEAPADDALLLAQ
jgi:hypothetical protein